MQHIFIINPKAGKGKALEMIPIIREYFKDKAEKFIIQITDHPGHATEIARKYSAIEDCRIYSVGGDGTINEVVNGIAGTQSALGVIPAGSGNDFIRSLTSAYDIKDILVRTIKGEEKSIDLGKVNDNYFINISSIGFDADVVFNADKFKKVPGITGSMAYVISIIYTVIKKKFCKVKINIDDRRMENKILLAAIANGRFYGGGMLAAPEAKIDDGLFDICLVSEASRFKILRLFPMYIKGQHGKLDEVEFLRGKKIQIESDEVLSLNIDGEIFSSSKIAFEIIEKGIKVVVPAI
ncbi:diacylglycerol kinase family lipid kinase [Ruminiclostridium herbifermentans]|uniref:Diacylglycerol kinase family lipid kinase n=1 Tax=Ruminiclostridium herbifermentans TaxID=2488810 RepID=A0A4U7JGF1_9FIRM|nr:diacylglycerol kinase family protein [Ruminiclostridium herbifermentans]QNU67047.1 diacylglycerol kinase family lipid kinase [Ruminiclostridium herbifermentans]